MRIKESAARVQNSEVTAVRVKDITRKGVRVYQDGKIGIAGVVGDAPEDVLLQDMPVMPMFFSRGQYAHSDRISNVKVDAFANVVLEDVTVNE